MDGEAALGPAVAHGADLGLAAHAGVEVAYVG
jgi:hypothetical protein